jgi:hypothetical protein
MKPFSQPLVDTCIEYFKRKYTLDISVDQANEYLHSFAKLYLAFTRPDGGRLAAGTLSAAGDSAVAEDVLRNSMGVSNTHGTLPDAS